MANMLLTGERLGARPILARFGASLPYLLLLMGAAGLVVAYRLVLHLRAMGLQSPVAREFLRLFDLNVENDVPTWYGSLLWQIAALCCILLAKEDSAGTGRIANRTYWIGLALVTLFLSMDEVAQFHDSTMQTLIADTTGPLHFYEWVIYGIGFFIVVGLFLARFILSLPRDIAALIILSAAVFVTGAIGFESLGGLVDRQAISDFPWILDWVWAISLEEFLEMAGVVLLIAALHTHLKRLRARSGGIAARVSFPRP